MSLAASAAGGRSGTNEILSFKGKRIDRAAGEGMSPQEAMDHLLKLGEQTQVFYSERKSSGQRAAAGRLSAVKGGSRVAGAGYGSLAMPSGRASAGKVPRYTPEDRKMMDELDGRLQSLLLELEMKRAAEVRRAPGSGADSRRASSIVEMRKAEARRAQEGQEKAAAAGTTAEDAKEDNTVDQMVAADLDAVNERRALAEEIEQLIEQQRRLHVDIEFRSIERDAEAVQEDSDEDADEDADSGKISSRSVKMEISGYVLSSKKRIDQYKQTKCPELDKQVKVMAFARNLALSAMDLFKKSSAEHNMMFKVVRETRTGGRRGASFFDDSDDEGSGSEELDNPQGIYVFAIIRKMVNKYLRSWSRTSASSHRATMSALSVTTRAGLPTFAAALVRAGNNCLLSTFADEPQGDGERCQLEMRRWIVAGLKGEDFHIQQLRNGLLSIEDEDVSVANMGQLINDYVDSIAAYIPGFWKDGASAMVAADGKDFSKSDGCWGCGKADTRLAECTEPGCQQKVRDRKKGNKGSSRGKGRDRGGKPETRSCYKCGKKGHITSDGKCKKEDIASFKKKKSEASGAGGAGGGGSTDNESVLIAALKSCTTEDDEKKVMAAYGEMKHRQAVLLAKSLKSNKDDTAMMMLSMPSAAEIKAAEDAGLSVTCKWKNSLDEIREALYVSTDDGIANFVDTGASDCFSNAAADLADGDVMSGSFGGVNTGNGVVRADTYVNKLVEMESTDGVMEQLPIRFRMMGSMPKNTRLIGLRSVMGRGGFGHFEMEGGSVCFARGSRRFEVKMHMIGKLYGLKMKVLPSSELKAHKMVDGQGKAEDSTYLDVEHDVDEGIRLQTATVKASLMVTHLSMSHRNDLQLGCETITQGLGMRRCIWDGCAFRQTLSREDADRIMALGMPGKQEEHQKVPMGEPDQSGKHDAGRVVTLEKSEPYGHSESKSEATMDVAAYIMEMNSMFKLDKSKDATAVAKSSDSFELDFATESQVKHDATEPEVKQAMNSFSVCTVASDAKVRGALHLGEQVPDAKPMDMTELPETLAPNNTPGLVWAVCVVWVDDMLLLSNCPRWGRYIKQRFLNRFKGTEEENPSTFLGLGIEKTKDGRVKITQSVLTKKYIDAVQALDQGEGPESRRPIKSASTPITEPSNPKLKGETPEEIKRGEKLQMPRLAGILSFLRHTRPDL
eukprot:g5604.t1